MTHCSYQNPHSTTQQKGPKCLQNECQRLVTIICKVHGVGKYFSTECSKSFWYKPWYLLILHLHFSRHKLNTYSYFAKQATQSRNSVFGYSLKFGYKYYDSMFGSITHVLPGKLLTAASFLVSALPLETMNLSHCLISGRLDKCLNLFFSMLFGSISTTIWSEETYCGEILTFFTLSTLNWSFKPTSSEIPVGVPFWALEIHAWLFLTILV